MAVSPLPRIAALSPYSPGLSIDEIAAKYNLPQVIKLASNENPLGASPLVVDCIAKNAAYAFRYPQGGNPKLRAALAKMHGVNADKIVVGNGSDEIIDLLIRMLAEPGEDNIVCFKPCFSIYPIQAAIAGVECRRQPLEEDFSFNFEKLLQLTDDRTRLAFVTAPDNPSGYLPLRGSVENFARALAAKSPNALLVIDEAYMDFAPDEKNSSLLGLPDLPENVAILRTFSKSYGLAGMRIGYGILPAGLADAFWRARLPFSINILAEKAALTALTDYEFRNFTLQTVNKGRERLTRGLMHMGCKVWPSAANFLMFSLPGAENANSCFEFLLQNGVIVRPLKSYGLPNHIRVSVGTERENGVFLALMDKYLHEKAHNHH